MINFVTYDAERFTWLFVQSRRSKPDRSDLLRIELPNVDGTKGLVISAGKLPVWAGVASAVSYYRNRTRWQAIYDPVEKGAIAIFSLDPDVLIADWIECSLPCLVCGSQLRAGAIYPYCTQHQNHAPERQRYQPKKN